MADEIEEFLTGVRRDEKSQGYSRPWCSPISSYPPIVLESWEMSGGTSCLIDMRPWSKDRSPGSTDSSSRARVTACSRRSTAQAEQSVAGLAIREAVRGLGLSIRIGVHTGEVEVRGDDIGGIAVHTAARVEALAQPDEMLVSRTVADLVAGSDISFTPRGTHTLKGVPGEWQLLAVAD